MTHQLFSLGGRFLAISKCRFSNVCDLFSDSSVTCIHESGSYCGRFRQLKGESKNSLKFVTVPPKLEKEISR